MHHGTAFFIPAVGCEIIFTQHRLFVWTEVMVELAITSLKFETDIVLM